MYRRRTMFARTPKLLVAIMLTASVALPAMAASSTENALFCKAIGLPSAAEDLCRTQLDGAMTMDDHKALQAGWVSQSALVSNSPSSLFKPPVDGNRLNGKPGTPYQSKIKHVP